MISAFTVKNRFLVSFFLEVSPGTAFFIDKKLAVHKKIIAVCCREFILLIHKNNLYNYKTEYVAQIKKILTFFKYMLK